MINPIAKFVYRRFFRSSASMLCVALVGGVFLEAFVDDVSIRIFHSINQGNLWDDVKHKYEKKPESL